MRQTRRRTQADWTPGKDVNDVWHKAVPKDIEWFYLRIVFLSVAFGRNLRDRSSDEAIMISV